MVVLHCHFDRVPLDRRARAGLQKCLKSIADHPWWIGIGVVYAIRRVLAEQYLGDNDGKEFRNTQRDLPPMQRWSDYYVKFYARHRDDSGRIVVSQLGNVYYSPDHYEQFVVLFTP